MEPLKNRSKRKWGRKPLGGMGAWGGENGEGGKLGSQWE